MWALLMMGWLIPTQGHNQKNRTCTKCKENQLKMWINWYLKCCRVTQFFWGVNKYDFTYLKNMLVN